MDYYNELAQGYDELHGEEQKRKLSIVDEHLAMKGHDLLLDVGCGTGFSSEFFNCRVIGIDNSKEMILEAKRRHANNADYILAQGEHLPFKDHIFDCVICVTALHNIPFPREALMEIKRVGNKRGAVTVLKKAKSARNLEAYVDEVFGITDIVDEHFDRILFFNISKNL